MGSTQSTWAAKLMRSLPGAGFAQHPMPSRKKLASAEHLLKTGLLSSKKVSSEESVLLQQDADEDPAAYGFASASSSAEFTQAGGVADDEALAAHFMAVDLEKKLSTHAKKGGKESHQKGGQKGCQEGEEGQEGVQASSCCPCC